MLRAVDSTRPMSDQTVDGNATLAPDGSIPPRTQQALPRGGIVASYLANHATTLAAAGRRGEARVLVERALEIRENALGPDHPDVADLLSNLGALHYADNELDEAERCFERGLDSARGSGDIVDESIALAHLANVASSRGEYERASALYLQALEIQRREMGDHPFVAITLHNLSTQAGVLERWDEARSWAEQSIAVFERALGPDTTRVHQPLLELARAHRHGGEPLVAVPLLERALALAERLDDPVARAVTELELARTLAALGQDLPRARTLATSAQRALEQQDEPERAAEAGEWLRDHAG